MKLESFKDKKATKRKVILISLGIITIVGVSLLLYKTFAKFSSEVSFPLMSGKVNYYGNADIIFAFYNGDQELDEMPQKGNSENLAFDHAVCDNEASVEWNEKEWGPVVLNLTKTKTRCTLYFAEKKFTGVDYLEEKVQEEQTKPEPELMYDDTEDKNLRFVGANPNNYIDIGDRYKDDIYKYVDDIWITDDTLYNSLEECESNPEHGGGTCKLLHKQGEPILWRIIGVMKNVINVETNKKEDLIKIIRADSIGSYSWDTSERGIDVDDFRVNDGNGVNEWSQADLMKLLNPGYSDNRDSICESKEGTYGHGGCSSYSENQLINNSLYWNNESGQCYISTSNESNSCDFKNIGISEAAKNKIAKVRWNTGTFATKDSSEWTASKTYKAERSENNGKQYCVSQCIALCPDCADEVERTTTWDGYIGLMNPSDYGYAIGKSVRETCLTKSMSNYSEDGCTDADWLKPSSSYELLLNPVSDSNEADLIFVLYSSYVQLTSEIASSNYDVRPVAFLKSNVTISDALGTKEDPFVAF